MSTYNRSDRKDFPSKRVFAIWVEDMDDYLTHNVNGVDTYLFFKSKDDADLASSKLAAEKRYHQVNCIKLW